MARLKRWIGCAALLLAAVGLILAAIAVVVVLRGEIVRNEVAVDAAWARLEGACRRRADLAPAILQALRFAGAGDAPAALELEEAHEQTALLIATSAVLDDPRAYGGFSAAHRRLGAAFEAVLPLATGGAAEGSMAREDLVAEVERAEARIATAESGLVSAVEAYNASIRRFPFSAVARLFGFRAKTVPSTLGESGDGSYNGGAPEES